MVRCLGFGIDLYILNNIRQCVRYKEKISCVLTIGPLFMIIYPASGSMSVTTVSNGPGIRKSVSQKLLIVICARFHIKISTNNGSIRFRRCDVGSLSGW